MDTEHGKRQECATAPAPMPTTAGQRELEIPPPTAPQIENDDAVQLQQQPQQQSPSAAVAASSSSSSAPSTPSIETARTEDRRPPGSVIADLSRFRRDPAPPPQQQQAAARQIRVPTIVVSHPQWRAPSDPEADAQARASEDAISRASMTVQIEGIHRCSQMVANIAAKVRGTISVHIPTTSARVDVSDRRATLVVGAMPWMHIKFMTPSSWNLTDDELACVISIHCRQSARVPGTCELVVELSDDPALDPETRKRRVQMASERHWAPVDPAAVCGMETPAPESIDMRVDGSDSLKHPGPDLARAIARAVVANSLLRSGVCHAVIEMPKIEGGAAPGGRVLTPAEQYSARRNEIAFIVSVRGVREVSLRTIDARFWTTGEIHQSVKAWLLVQFAAGEPDVRVAVRVGALAAHEKMTGGNPLDTCKRLFDSQESENGPSKFRKT